MKENNFEKGRTLVIKLDNLAFGGEAVGRKDGFVFFVPGGIPGEKVEIEVTAVKKSYARCEIIKILERSPQRVEPSCRLHGICGGCGLQHIDYEYQLFYKRTMVEDCIFRIGKLKNVEVLPVIGAKNPWNYRHKVQAPFGRGDEPYLGLFARGTHRVIGIEDCPVQQDTNNRVLREVTRLVKEFGWQIYDEKKHEGALRYLLSRSSKKTGNAQVIIVSSKSRLKGELEFGKALGRAVPEVNSIWLNYNPAKGNVVLGDEYHLIAGEEYLEEGLGGIDFWLFPGSFFQVNINQAEVLVSHVLSEVLSSGYKRVLDLYCGAGAFSLPVARYVSEVTGVEESIPAIESAERNTRINNIDNVKFIHGKAEEVIENLPGKYYDIVILDPPRKGCDPDVLKSIAKNKSSEIIYISCNPSTLARDLGILANKGYGIRKIQPLDMFPHTPHIECIAVLEHL
ncbi:MAG: 23S rRNA (uracil(1939)-C(5))-methyltransferase RlmD, partial [Candidatus Eremiobacteraeota bacterium]|nr:23S rRNA (uracil(1939)-C(5))-methyltransferase RlmD [Candidatus Eremiobacteraeota bacterium]